MNFRSALCIRRAFFGFLCCLAFLLFVELSLWMLDENHADSCHHLSALNTDHRLAIIIPFRDRLKELELLLPHLQKFLLNQNVPHSFYVVHQMDNLRFNRGALLNAGFIESFRIEQDTAVHVASSYWNGFDGKRFCFPPTDYVALHDVDLLPMDPEIQYTWPGVQGPHHPIPAPFHPRYYWYAKYFGGILIITRQQFTQVNGMSNSFWGWGAEDDEFRRRIVRAGYVISTPSSLSLGREAFRSVHNEKLHVRDSSTYYDPRVRNLVHSAHGGLSSVNYSVVSRELILVKEIPVTMINVRLKCNMPIELCQQNPLRRQFKASQ